MLATEESVHGGKLTKIDRYGWTMQDKPGRFMMLHKNAIRVDADYQRGGYENKIKEIASNWSWIAFSAATVAFRPDGSYYAIDAQQRILAARKRADIELLPCMVFMIAEVAAEARGFLAVNTLRKPLTGFDKYKALVLTGDAPSAALMKMTAKHGYDIHNASRPGSLRGIRMATRLIQVDEDALDLVFDVMEKPLGRCYAHERILDSLFFLQTRGLIDLTDKRVREAIEKVGYDGLLDATSRAGAYHSKGGARVWAEGIANALNKGRRRPVCMVPTSIA